MLIITCLSLLAGLPPHVPVNLLIRCAADGTRSGSPQNTRGPPAVLHVPVNCFMLPQKEKKLTSSNPTAMTGLQPKC